MFTLEAPIKQLGKKALVTQLLPSLPRFISKLHYNVCILRVLKQFLVMSILLLVLNFEFLFYFIFFVG
jgi:hypothetical protein